MSLSILKYQDNLSRYLEEIYKIPILTDEEEKRYAKLKEQGDINAAKILISSHLRLVSKIAFKYKNYGLSMMDLISEGNIGLMKAVKEFSTDKECKLATYAAWWIRASMQDFILRSWSLVKIGTTVNQKKLFFNLNKIKNKILECGQRELTDENIKYIANSLNVSENEVKDMNKRMSRKDISLNIKNKNLDNDNKEILELLPSKYIEPEKSLMLKLEKKSRQEVLTEALSILNDRERNIIKERKLSENPLTLKDLSEKYEISGERIRQIEESAIKKLQNYINNRGRKNV